MKAPRDKVFQPDAEAVQAGPKLDKVEQWRYDQLRRAGYTESQALMLALDRHNDLHNAVSLAETAGPRLAYAIVSR